MAGPNEGFRYIIVVEAIADAPAGDYANGTLAYDSTTNFLNVLLDGTWTVVATVP